MAAPLGNKYAQDYTDEDLVKIGELLIEFADGPENVHWADFCRKYKKPISWLINMAVRREVFAPYYELANNIMAAKYAKACLTNQWNASFGEKYLPIYDNEYKQLMKWKAELAKPKLSREDIETIVQVVDYSKGASKEKKDE